MWIFLAIWNRILIVAKEKVYFFIISNLKKIETPYYAKTLGVLANIRYLLLSRSKSSPIVKEQLGCLWGEQPALCWCGQHRLQQIFPPQRQRLSPKLEKWRNKGNKHQATRKRRKKEMHPLASSLNNRNKNFTIVMPFVNEIEKMQQTFYAC